MRKSGTGVAITIRLVLFLITAHLIFSSPLSAQAQFYQGKNISFIIGSQSGSLYDLWARLTANHMSKYIAGKPALVGQNIPGAGSLIAANQIYNVAKPDGLTIGALLPGIYMDQLIGRKEVQFDWSRFRWLGTPEQTEWVFVTRRDSPYKSIDDMRAAAEPAKCGSTGTGSFLYLVPKLMEETLGVKLVLITGYQGGPDVDLAMERGEVHCRAVSTTAYFGREPYLTWGKNGFVRPLAQTGKKREPALMDVPTIYELMDQHRAPEAGRRLATVILAANIFGRPMVAPPGIPTDRLLTLREAWNRTVKDPEFLAEAKKRGWPIGPVAGEELDALAKEVIAQPPEVVQRLKKILTE
jgi:tripartite-type tricarboxylate transporter receptor subunit TctC